MISTVLTRHVPSMIIKICTCDQPWFDESCKRVYHDKQTTFNAWRRTKANYNIFNESRRAANRVYHQAERTYIIMRRQLEEVRQPLLWWTKLKSTIYGSISALPPLLLPDGKLTNNTRGEAELLHRAF